jgi:uncharacterized protein YciI
MHYLLIYDVGDDFIKRREEFRDEHLSLAWRTAGTGDLLLAGALEEPTEQAFLLFQGTSPDGARKFAESDPYVRHGLVRRWRSGNGTPWLAMQRASPKKPNGV